MVVVRYIGSAGVGRCRTSPAEQAMRHLHPRTKVIVVVRDPVEALLSHYNHMECGEMTTFGEMIASNATDCVPGRGWGSWREKIEFLETRTANEQLVVHLAELETEEGLQRVLRFLLFGEKTGGSEDEGEKSEAEREKNSSRTEAGTEEPRNVDLADLVRDRLMPFPAENAAGKRLGGKTLAFADVPEATKQLATRFYKEERESLAETLRRHGAPKVFGPKHAW